MREHAMTPARGMLAAAAAVALGGCPDDEACDGWASLAELDRAVLSVQGTNADDVWVVGGGLGLGGPMAAHWDGVRWTRHDPDGATGADTLWWVWTASDGTVWMVGERGLVVRRRGDDVTVDRIATDATLFGVWGSAPDDVWIVGGQPGGGGEPEDDFVRRWDGTAFQPVVGVPARGATLFKVWGSGAGDVWLSGEGGGMLHATAAGVVDHSSELSTAAPALTVHGCSASEVYAVAGQNLYAWDGTRWMRRSEPAFGSVANGVSCGASGVLVVGNAGLKLFWDRASGAWTDERASAPSGVDLHGAWFDDAGRAWAVGGNFNAPMPTSRRGVVGARGCPRPSSL
jgi:hypothetical protein